MIPRRLVRTVPLHTSDFVERNWQRAAELHPGWQLVTWRDPIDPAAFPVTSPHWDRCTSGAQRAGLIRLEDLLHRGGIYLDSDVEPFRSLDPLLPLHAFAAWEDERVVPDAVLGAKPRHPAIAECLDLAIEAIERGPWESGPGVTTRVLPGRDDVLLLPPGAFFPIHYRKPDRRALRRSDRGQAPWIFAVHHWSGSWLERAA